MVHVKSQRLACLALPRDGHDWLRIGLPQTEKGISGP